MSRWRSVWSLLWPILWVSGLVVLMLGPALAPGFVLTYDMVWVPSLALRSDFWGVGSALPRAVPSDAIVALADLLLPGMVLQKVVLVGSLVGAGLGAGRLVGGFGAPAILVATSVYLWNPYVTERLVLGHWPVLVGYAVLPWIVLATRRWRQTGTFPLALLWLVPLGSLSASAGLATGLLLVMLAAFEGGVRRVAAVGAIVVAANAPWVVSGLLHFFAAGADPDGAAVFALADVGRVPGPLAALGLGGIWNSEVVLDSRTGPLGVVWLVFLGALACAGVRVWWQRTESPENRGLVACWLLGYALAVTTWVAPQVVADLGATVPGAGLLRDGGRILALCAPLVACLAGVGAARIVERLRGAKAVSIAGTLVLAWLPITLMPDAAWGASGRLHPVDYPTAYEQARDVILAEGANQGDVLVLPLTSYRAPDWNRGAKVLDPAGRYLPRDYVASDELVVSGTALAGEDPRVRDVRRALAAADPRQRSARLTELGIGFVAVSDLRAEIPAIEGDTRVDAPSFRLIDLAIPGAATPEPGSWLAAMAAAWVVFFGLPVIVVVISVRGRSRAGRTATAP